jgi:excisionase family DNA binding protein
MVKEPELDIPDRLSQRKTAMTVSELAELMAVSDKQVYKLTGKLNLPHYRIRGCIRFDPTHIARWLREHAA